MNLPPFLIALMKLDIIRSKILYSASIFLISSVSDKYNTDSRAKDLIYFP